MAVEEELLSALKAIFNPELLELINSDPEAKRLAGELTRNWATNNPGVANQARIKLKALLTKKLEQRLATSAATRLAWKTLLEGGEKKVAEKAVEKVAAEALVESGEAVVGMKRVGGAMKFVKVIVAPTPEGLMGNAIMLILPSVLTTGCGGPATPQDVLAAAFSDRRWAASTLAEAQDAYRSYVAQQEALALNVGGVHLGPSMPEPMPFDQFLKVRYPGLVIQLQKQGGTSRLSW